MQYLATTESVEQRASPQYYELRCTDQPEGTATGAVVALCLASGLVAVGLYAYLAAVIAGSTSPLTWLLSAAATLLGVLAIPASARRVAYTRGLGRPRLEVSTEALVAGDPFQVRYVQDVAGSPRVDVALSLVAREVVTAQTNEGEQFEVRDHLVQFAAESVVPGSGITLVRIHHEFTIPATGASEYRTGSWPVDWLIKTRLDLGGGVTLWREYELPYYVDRLTLTSSDGWRRLEAEPSDMHSVYLVQCKWPMPRVQLLAAQTVAPHLTASQIYQLGSDLPAALAENLTRSAAEAARARLEAAGAVVEVREGIRVVEPPPGRRFPIPHTLPGGTGGSLPLPSEEVQAESDGSMM